MHADQPPTRPTKPSVKPSPRQRKRERHYVFSLANWIVGIVVLLILIGVALPTGGGIGTRGYQVKSMMQAKRIALALKIFAGDHDGDYPRAGLPGILPATVRDANAAFAMLFPAYLGSEDLFGNPLSVYQTRRPDNVIDSPYTGRPVHTLEPGENVYSYVAGLSETVRADTPLLADGTDGTGHYTTDPQKRGGLWEGKKALVVFLDDSAVLETLAGPEHSRYVPRHPTEPGRDGGNRLDVSALGPGVRLLDPAVRR